VRQQAATHMSLTGRGRPRWTAAADSRPQVAATASSPGSTAMWDSQLVSSSRRCWPQLRISAHLASSPKGHEGDQRLTADQAGGKRPGECSLVQQRGDIGVQDGWVHGWGQAKSR
jgi:hypothetical protein